MQVRSDDGDGEVHEKGKKKKEPARREQDRPFDVVMASRDIRDERGDDCPRDEFLSVQLAGKDGPEDDQSQPRSENRVE